MDKELIAPCGMNCAICSGYLAFKEGIPRKRGAITHCAGCRRRHKLCAYIKGNCSLLSQEKVQFCYECGRFPCKRLSNLDSRYRKTFSYSPIDNLRFIAAQGADAFLQHDHENHRCGKCGGVVCVHNGKCYKCDTILSWRG